MTLAKILDTISLIFSCSFFKSQRLWRTKIIIFFATMNRNAGDEFRIQCSTVLLVIIIQLHYFLGEKRGFGASTTTLRKIKRKSCFRKAVSCPQLSHGVADL